MNVDTNVKQLVIIHKHITSNMHFEIIDVPTLHKLSFAQHESHVCIYSKQYSSPFKLVKELTQIIGNIHASSTFLWHKLNGLSFPNALYLGYRTNRTKGKIRML
jgi:hypothetical protein